MARFQEITERYKAQMRDTHERHMRRVDDINNQAALMTLVIVAVILSPLLILLWVL